MVRPRNNDDRALRQDHGPEYLQGQAVLVHQCLGSGCGHGGLPAHPVLRDLRKELRPLPRQQRPHLPPALRAHRRGRHCRALRLLYTPGGRLHPGGLPRRGIHRSHRTSPCRRIPQGSGRQVHRGPDVLRRARLLRDLRLSLCRGRSPSRHPQSLYGLHLPVHGPQILR